MKVRRIFGMVMLLSTLLMGVPVASQDGSGPDVVGGEPLAPSVAPAPDGSLWAAWTVETGGDWDIVANPGNGRAGGIATVVDAQAGRWDATPNLAFDAEGVAWLVWSSRTEADEVLYVSHWTGQGWSPAQALAFQGITRNRQPVLAPAPDGRLWLAWVGFDGNDDEIYAASWSGQSWSEPRRVSRDDADPEAYDTQPRLAVGTDGSVWLAWTGYEAFLDDGIFASYWDGQQWSAEQQVSALDGLVDGYPTLAVAQDGTAWLAWQGRDAAVPGGGRRIYVARGNQANGWGPESMISSPVTSDVTEGQPCLVLDAAGQPNVTWQVDEGAQGLGLATRGEDGWSEPQRLVQEAVVESTCVVGKDGPTVVWWPATASGQSSFSQKTIEGELSPLPVRESPATLDEVTWVVLNRHMAFGDSITWGLYDDPVTGQPVGSYPMRLEEMLDTRVVDSEVVNEGVPGEQTPGGRKRLYDYAWEAHHPKYVEIMEGTNDITRLRPPNDIADNLSLMVKDSQEYGSQVLLSTVIPRKDGLNPETSTLNTYIRKVASKRGVPLVDNWEALYSHADWPSLYVDNVHPNAEGMAILTATWYDSLVHSYLTEETTPPTTWIEPLPSQSPCGVVAVSWNGTDNMSWVEDYDVQVQVNSVWSDWLLATQGTSGTYYGGSYDQTIGFRVRGRDAVGNQSDYSTPVYTTLVDDQPPHDVQVYPLGPAQKPPFSVRWTGVDGCGPIDKFEVEYRVGQTGSWILWQSGTNTSAIFGDGEPVQYGETYYFRVRAYDAGGLSTESSVVSTAMARFTLAGQVVTIAHEPIGMADTVVTNALDVVHVPGGYRAYVPDSGDYDVTVSHSGFGPLPTMHLLSVASDLDDLDVVLPPLDDVVGNGGFESGSWGEWQAGGTIAPTLASGGHSGDGSALLGGTGGTSSLSQSLSVPAGLSNPTLSFLVRLDGSTGSSSVLIELQGAGIDQVASVLAGGWLHVSLPVDGALGKQVTLALTVSDATAVRIDEVSLGSAQSGGSLLYLPSIRRVPAP